MPPRKPRSSAVLAHHVQVAALSAAAECQRAARGRVPHGEPPVRRELPGALRTEHPAILPGAVGEQLGVPDRTVRLEVGRQAGIGAQHGAGVIAHAQAHGEQVASGQGEVGRAQLQAAQPFPGQHAMHQQAAPSPAIAAVLLRFMHLQRLLEQAGVVGEAIPVAAVKRGKDAAIPGAHPAELARLREGAVQVIDPVGHRLQRHDAADVGGRQVKAQAAYLTSHGTYP